MSSLQHIFLLICCVFHSGVSQNSKITCPQLFYEEGSSTLKLTINSSTFGGCGIGPASVTCRWYPKTGTERVICIQSVTSCDQTLTSRGCRCDSVSGPVYEYSLSFSKLTGEETGNISCSLDCIVVPGNPGPKATVDSDQTCQNIDFESKCRTFGCEHGVCRINGTEPFCDCTGTDYKGNFCEETIGAVKEVEKLTICLIVVATGAFCIIVLIIVIVIVVAFRFCWKTTFSCVISVIVRVETETEKKTLESHATKTKLQDFISKQFLLQCCCCCCCSSLGCCCLSAINWRGRKTRATNDGNVEGNTFASTEGCSMGCVWCLSSVAKVEVDVHRIEDDQVLFLIRLESPLSWYAEAEDMPAEVEEYIRTKILKEPAKKQSDTTKPLMGLSVGYKAGSPDISMEPPADYPAGPPKAQTKYTGNGNGQPKKSKSDKAIPLSTVGRSSPPSETSGDEKTHMIPSKKGRVLPVPANQHDPTSTGIGKSASPRLDPLTQDHSKMTSIERNSGAFSRALPPSPVRSPLDPIPTGKTS